MRESECQCDEESEDECELSGSGEEEGAGGVGRLKVGQVQMRQITSWYLNPEEYDKQIRAK